MRSRWGAWEESVVSRRRGGGMHEAGGAGDRSGKPGATTVAAGDLQARAGLSGDQAEGQRQDFTGERGRIRGIGPARELPDLALAAVKFQAPRLSLHEQQFADPGAG